MRCKIILLIHFFTEKKSGKKKKKSSRTAAADEEVAGLVTTVDQGEAEYVAEDDGGAVVVVEQEPFDGEDMAPAPVPEAEPQVVAVVGDDEEQQQNGHDNNMEEGLAVAMAVDTAAEDDYIYAAIEYDPDSKPPLHKNRRFRVYTCLAFVLIVAAVAVTVVYVTQGAKGSMTKYTDININTLPTLQPTPSPITDREASGIIEQIEAGVLQRGAVFADMTLDDPRRMALEWILHYDELQLESDSVNLYQRYILALLAFSLDSLAWYYCGNHRMVTTNETLDFVQEDCDVLSATGQLVPYKVWLSSTDECEWYGAKCSSADGVLRGLELSEFFLLTAVMLHYDVVISPNLPFSPALILFFSLYQWATSLLGKSHLRFLNCVSSNTLPSTVTVCTVLSLLKWALCPTCSLSSFKVTVYREKSHWNLAMRTSSNCSMLRCNSNTPISVPHRMEGS